MWVRELKRKTTKNISVQIVESYRNKERKPRVRIVRHMGSVHPDAVDGLVKIAYLELARIQEDLQPSLFPAESYVDEVVAARRKKRESKALVIKDARKLEEPILFIMDFPMAPKCVFGCEESGFPV